MARSQGSGEKVWCQVKMKGEKGPQHLIEALSVPQLSVFSLITLPKPSPPKAFWTWNSQMGGFVPSTRGLKSSAKANGG